MKTIIALLVLCSIFFSCSKSTEILPAEIVKSETPEDSVLYNIATGEHYSDKSVIRPVSLEGQLFKVIFDSSAIYTTVDPLNQFDVNKLYGFIEGFDPHVNSARIGWSYNNNRLRLYAYVYSNAQRLIREITPVQIGEKITCSIKIQHNKYIFSVNGIIAEMERTPNTTIAQGYQLFPYFGGDETAPHSIRINIRELPFEK